MELRLGDTAPNLQADTTEGHIDFYQWVVGDGWAVLFSHPKDFTSVCTTELGAVAVANLYGMIHPNASDTFTLRSVFVIRPDNKVKLMLTYPASTGRNFEEILRVIDSLQLTYQHSVATPADWKNAEGVIMFPRSRMSRRRRSSLADGKLSGPISGTWRSSKVRSFFEVRTRT